MLHLVENDTRWLNEAPDWWDLNPDYNRASCVANAMLIVNDCAERNIKHKTDYTRFTRNIHGMLDNIILVGEDCNSLIPNMNRENLLKA